MPPSKIAWRIAAAAAILFALAAGLSAPAAALSGDTEPPVLQWFSPPDGGFVNMTKVAPQGGARVEVTAGFFDAGSALAPNNTSISVWSEARADFETADQYAANQGNNYSSVEAFALYFLPDGPYRIFFVATDDAGNTANRSSTFVVDTIPPSINLAAPSFVNSTTLHVQVDARDAGSGIAPPVLLSYKTACLYTWSTITVQAIELPGRLVGEADVPVCVGSGNQFTVVVGDRAGNGESASRTGIACDLAPPTFSGFTPNSFDRLETGSVYAAVTISDDASGPNASRVEYRVSTDGGIVFSAWQPAYTREERRTLRANVTIDGNDGATIALEWRAWDLAGNGPSTSRTEFFYINGPPFLESFAPADGTQVYNFNEVRIQGLAADPDADSVIITVSSDVDGPLGRADGRPVRLSLGLHNLTVALDDSHGHVVRYVYQLLVIPRPPPDPRPLWFTMILAGVMAWAAFATYAKGEEEREKRESAPPKA
jgi:hypothetical protein